MATARKVAKTQKATKARKATTATAAKKARKTAAKRSTRGPAPAAPVRRTARKAAKQPSGRGRTVTGSAPVLPAARSAAPVVVPARRRVAAVAVPRSILRVKLTLDALFEQTNINGPHTTSSEVKRFRDDPALAIQDPQLFGLVSNLAVGGWYPGMGRPDDDERDRLWVQLRETLARPARANPGGWDGSTAVITLALKADKP